jgi:hypothetical protein
MQDRAGFSVGLWAEVPGAVCPLSTGLEWGEGSVCLRSKDGAICTHTTLNHSLPELSAGAPVDIQDTTGAVCWRPGTVVSEEEDKVGI